MSETNLNILQQITQEIHELLTRGSVLHANNESKGNTLKKKKKNCKQDVLFDYTQLCINSKHIIARAMRHMWTNDSISMLVQLNYSH